MAIEVFPSVDSVTVEFDGEWLTITQENHDLESPDIVMVPNRLIDAFLSAINRSLGE